jgi:hypothetical protein
MKDPDIPSRLLHIYDSMGNTFDYVYELDGEALTIWAGAHGSPAYFRGTFTDGDRTMAATGSTPEAADTPPA